MDLTSENVNKIFLDCLFDEDTEENQEKAIIVEGIMSVFGFDPDRIKKHKNDIISLLMQLPKEFQRNGGGGWSFLNACNRDDGEQWTGLHGDMERLFSLGIACGYAKFQLPRDMWKILPGGMPYVCIGE